MWIWRILLLLTHTFYTPVNKRDTEAAEEFASREKRQIAREGDPSIRCHPGEISVSYHRTLVDSLY